MDDEVHGVVEGAVGEDGADGLVGGEGEAIGGGGVEPHGDFFAVRGAEGLDAAVDAIDGAGDLGA